MSYELLSVSNFRKLRKDNTAITPTTTPANQGAWMLMLSERKPAPIGPTERAIYQASPKKPR